METINVYKKNEVYLKVECDRGMAMELSSYFEFEVPGASFIPSVRAKMWDGRIRLFNVNTMQIYVGLLEKLKKFAADRDYQVIAHDGLEDTIDIPINGLEKFLSDGKYKPRDYQLRAVAHAVRNHRALILSPTASGKSFIIYCLIKYYLRKECKKALIIVPTTSLVTQLDGDFKDYSESLQFYYTWLVSAGKEKSNDDAKIIISTWQSIYKQPKSYFDQFDLIIGDEAHLFKANSLTKIMEKMVDCKYRFGFTGTLDESVTNKLVLEGLFGPVMRVITTKELIDNKTLAEFRIKCLVLKYSDETRKRASRSTYPQEMDFLVGNEKRNQFIKNLTLTRKGNTLVLFQYVKKHGEVLYKQIQDAAAEGRKVFFVFGGVDAETREQVRAITEKENDAIIIASYGTFSTGINIRNLHNVIFASPSKSRIRNLQSIGRGLRKGENKSVATLYDISDDLCHKSWKNHTLKHFAVRVAMYNEENFDYKIYNIGIENGNQLGS